MTEQLQALLKQVLALPKKERIELLNAVHESLEPPGMTEEEWTVEIRRRVAELRAGTAELLDWEEARALIRGSRR